MKKAITLFLSVLIFISCATNNDTHQNIKIDEAINNAADQLEDNISNGKIMALFKIDSPTVPCSEYILDELTTRLVNGKKLTLVERNRLDIVRNELQFQLSGEVSDESAQRIGYMLGANYVVTGSLLPMRDWFNFRVKALNVETGAIESAVSIRISGKDQQISYLLQQDQADNERLVALSQKNPTISESTSSNSGGTPPRWIRSVNDVYDRSNYVAAVGAGADIDEAMLNATNALVSIFGMYIQIGYEAKDETKATNAFDYIIGAEIKEIWYDKKGTFYAVAAVYKPTTFQQYSRLINDNQKIINNLISMPPSEKYTFNGFARYIQAANIADTNNKYNEILDVMTGTQVAGLKSGYIYRAEAESIIEIIPIEVISENDRNGRIRNSFISSLEQLGFRNGGNNSPYFVRVSINIENNQRYTITANLINRITNSVFFTYNLHENGTDENRIISTLEAKIRGEFGIKFWDFLNSYIPVF